MAWRMAELGCSTSAACLRSRSLPLCAAAVLFWSAAAQAFLAPDQVPIEACEGLKIGILDLGSFATGEQYPSCNYSLLVVNTDHGTIYLSDVQGKTLEEEGKAGDHSLGAHAGPWYLLEAIRNSMYYTHDLEDADIIVVDDYCYYMWWLATVHTRGRNIKESPGDYLMAGYKALMQTPRWQKNGGQEFVFYDSHPGFAAGDAFRPYEQLKCFKMRRSTHLVMDTPMRYMCGGGWAYNKLFIVPYIPNSVNVSEPAAHLKQPFLTLENRTLLTYHRAACAPLKDKINNYNAGKMLRRYLAQALTQEPKDVQVKCTNFDHTSAAGGAKMLKYAPTFEHMRRTVFCLVLPGDSASTRRLSEIMMAGCIPTFVGPPYHAMPFIQDIDYRNAAVFFNITDYSPWLEVSMQTSYDPKQKAMHPTEGRWWLPDGDIASRAITVGAASDIIERMRGFSAAEAEQKLELMRDFRHYFSFEPRLTQPPNAVNVILSGICRRAPLKAENV